MGGFYLSYDFLKFAKKSWLIANARLIVIRLRPLKSITSTAFLLVSKYLLIA